MRRDIKESPINSAHKAQDRVATLLDWPIRSARSTPKGVCHVMIFSCARFLCGQFAERKFISVAQRASIKTTKSGPQIGRSTLEDQRNIDSARNREPHAATDPRRIGNKLVTISHEKGMSSRNFSRPICTSNSPPHHAITRSSVNRIRKLPSVISISAAASSFPTSKFATRAANGSKAPLLPTPIARCPKRPRSCTLASGPARRICAIIRLTSRNPRSASMVASREKVHAFKFSNSSRVMLRNRTRSPAQSSAGGSRRTSNIRSGVRPMTFQPPGDRMG